MRAGEVAAGTVSFASPRLRGEAGICAANSGAEGSLRESSFCVA